MDNGCSNHLSGNESLFSFIDKNVKYHTKMWYNWIVLVVGKGSIMIHTKQGEKKEIQNVYFSPGIKHNLMSVGQLIQNGYNFLMEKGECVIFDKDWIKKVVAAVQMTKNWMFPLRIEICFSSQSSVAPPKKACTIVQQYVSLKSSIEDPSNLWHLKHGHLGYAGLILLSKKRMVDGLPSIEEPSSKCEASILGKQHRMSFQKENSSREREPL